MDPRYPVWITQKVPYDVSDKKPKCEIPVWKITCRFPCGFYFGKKPESQWILGVFSTFNYLLTTNPKNLNLPVYDKLRVSSLWI